MPEPMTLAGVLTKVEDAHLKVMDAASSIVMCICGEWVAMYVGGSPGDDRDHRAHVRAEQVRAVREWLAGEEILKAAAHAIHGNTIIDPGNGESMIREQRDMASVILDAAAALDAVRDRCC